jgi:hypothetical protein
MVVVGCLFGVVGLSFATIGPAVRSSLGYPTFQWHGVDQEKVAAEKASTALFVREALGQAPQLKRS